MELEESGFLASHNVKLLGTTAATIKKAEDRQEFKDTMEKIGEPFAASKVVESIEDGIAWAVITFGSPNYDYMIVGDEKYLCINEEGNSSFEIPVAAFDLRLGVKADTVAMSQPHEIDYALLFDSATIQAAQ